MANKYTRFRFLSLTHKECSKCGLIKPFEDFHKHKSGPGGRTYFCAMCARNSGSEHHRRRMLGDPLYKESKRSSYIKHKHGITTEEYEAMLASQGHKCAICKVELLSRGHSTHLDHCHNTGKLRAMLCTNCNRGLGHFQDSVEFLEEAISYLNSHNSGVV